VHFRITVGDSIDPSSMMLEGEALSLASRRMNRLLRAVLTRGVELHADAD
jgi:hypothetical protein